MSTRLFCQPINTGQSYSVKGDRGGGAGVHPGERQSHSERHTEGGKGEG